MSLRVSSTNIVANRNKSQGNNSVSFNAKKVKHIPIPVGTVSGAISMPLAALYPTRVTMIAYITTLLEARKLVKKALLDENIEEETSSKETIKDNKK